jgi:Lrp/AsnC family transcriptional regulator, leucine-responsive regulatory protein
VKSHLDATDLEILRLLQADGRITNADLAKKVNLSPPSALQRVRNLEKAGLINGYHAVLDHEKLGLRVTVIAMIGLSLHQDRPIEQFRRAIASIPEITECYHISGDHDFLLKILVKDIRAYEALIREKISRIQGVQKISSSFVLGVPKRTTEIPLS